MVILFFLCKLGDGRGQTKGPHLVKKKQKIPKKRVESAEKIQRGRGSERISGIFAHLSIFLLHWARIERGGPIEDEPIRGVKVTFSGSEDTFSLEFSGLTQLTCCCCSLSSIKSHLGDTHGRKNTPHTHDCLMSICNTSFETEASTSKVKKKIKRNRGGKKGAEKLWWGKTDFNT